MKTIKKQKSLMQVFLLMVTFAFFALASCSKDDDEPAEDPIASFQYEVSEDNHLEVKFMNFSQNAETYNWDFGDGNSSTEENPTHIYDVADTYEVTLTAINADGVNASFSETIVLEDPDVVLAMLAGETSKTWKLYRVETSMGVGPDLDNPRDWWSLMNDGYRPCKYYHEFTFHRNGDYVFDDKGFMWAEAGVFHEDLVGECIEAIPANMVGPDGEDLSPWLGGTHSFELNPNTMKVTLNGLGAWIGIVKVATEGEVTVPQTSVTFEIEIEEREGYDYMHVFFAYDWGVWSFSYAHYHDPSLEPDVVEEQDEDPPLETITPTELGHTFETDDSFDYLGAIDGASIINTGADDPEDAGATKVGEFIRTDAQYQEAMLRVYPEPKNILYDNFTTVSLDVFLPSDNEYDPLTQKVIIGFADRSHTTEWWTRLIQYESDELPLDEWVTVTFDLDSPSFASNDGETVYDREDLDMVFIQIGGGDHTSEGIFYIRDLIFE